MSKKISLRLGGRDFNVDVDENFATFLEEQMSYDFNIGTNNDLKKMFHAYVKKTYELYLQDKKISDILTKTEI